MSEKTKTFTLIELILVVAIVAVLAGAMIPMITSVRQEARAAKFLQFVDTIRDACIMYHSDTGRYPGGTWHSLLRRDGWPGWDGPYIERLPTDEDAYAGTTTWIWGILTDNFDFDGDGATDKSDGSPGSALLLSPVPESAAQILNDQADNNVLGDWRSTGRVNYHPAGGGVGWVMIYLIGGD
ncbi:MAG: prepilin-type N-terminal cleavage/methylation domain-containing protein [Nitrospirota bacterium]